MAAQIIQSKGMVGVGSVWKIKNTEKVHVLPITEASYDFTHLTYSETADSGTSAASSSSVVPAGIRKRAIHTIHTIHNSDSDSEGSEGQEEEEEEGQRMMRRMRRQRMLNK